MQPQPGQPQPQPGAGPSGPQPAGPQPGAPAATQNGAADYSAQWAEYYRSMGKIKEAEAIEAQMKAGKVCFFCFFFWPHILYAMVNIFYMFLLLYLKVIL